jgi:hypothetical protein
MEQWTKAKTENKKNRKIMKKMKTTILTSVALAACVSTQLFAGNSKEDTITFSLNLQGQQSVSTTAGLNVGNWSQQPTHYKTIAGKLTQQSLIKAIGVILHGNGDGVTGANYYSSKATLVLVQGELSGFFNVIPGLSINSIPDPDMDGTFSTDAATGVSTIIPDATVTYVTLANGRHYQQNPVDSLYPVGHFQPWGQIFVKDPANAHQTGIVCDNATFFFNLEVQECYDCFYLNSFISDSVFNYSTSGGGNAGPPCCTIPTQTTLFGKGTDRYYLTLSFDNTYVNPYLDNRESNLTGLYTGFPGIHPTVGFVDGTLPDALTYSDPIKSGLGSPSPYEIRFTLNGILTYNWQLKLINSSDVLPDFIGTANYAANGYGFIQLTCQLITGTAAISEKIVKSATCCDDVPWSDNWFGIGWDGDANDLVSETGAPGVLPAGTYTTTQENVSLSLTSHQRDWVVTGPVTY